MASSVVPVWEHSFLKLKKSLLSLKYCEISWSTDIAKKEILIHRRNEFRGADESVSNVQDLKNEGKIIYYFLGEIL